MANPCVAIASVPRVILVGHGVKMGPVSLRQRTWRVADHQLRARVREITWEIDLQRVVLVVVCRHSNLHSCRTCRIIPRHSSGEIFLEYVFLQAESLPLTLGPTHDCQQVRNRKEPEGFTEWFDARSFREVYGHAHYGNFPGNARTRRQSRVAMATNEIESCALLLACQRRTDYRANWKPSNCFYMACSFAHYSIRVPSSRHAEGLRLFPVEPQSKSIWQLAGVQMRATSRAALREAPAFPVFTQRVVFRGFLFCARWSESLSRSEHVEWNPADELLVKAWL